jgi:hypothetical protein
MSDASRVVAGTFADIEAALRDLGPPAPTHRRVFRGQNRGWLSPDGAHTITPALSRTSAPKYDPAWLTRMTQFLYSETGQEGDGVPIEFGLVWSPALIQQYGPGSFFVDVTFDLPTALWFALNTWHTERRLEHVGSNATGVYNRAMPVAWHEPLRTWQDAPPVVYVFDLPEWDGIVVPQGAAIVDPLKSPLSQWVGTVATRLQAQQAALLHAHPTITDARDVGPLVRLSIALAPGFDRSSVPGIDRPTSAIFPAPADDPFYRQLLTLPGSFHFSPGRLEHPLNVYWYFDARPDSTTALTPFLPYCTHLVPPLLHPELTKDPLPSDFTGVSDRDAALRLSDALVLLFESVALISTPSGRDDELSTWNEPALRSDVAPMLAERPTTSVYVEFSAIDTSGPAAWMPSAYPRAAWLIRHGVEYELHLFFSSLAGMTHERFTLHWDDSVERFRPDPPCPAERAPLARKVLLVILAALRDLSPGDKSRAVFPGIVDGRVMRLADTVGQRARLEPVARGRYFAVRGLDGRPYGLGTE